jgi:hypothetical protein
MPDLRGIPPFVAGGPVFLTPLELEQAEPNMTVGNLYELWGLIVDSPATGGVTLYALVVGDDRHFKHVPLAKLRLRPPPVNPPPEEGAP